MRARCLCGDVTWEVDGPLQRVHHCHCSRCQKAHGAAYATVGGVPASQLRWPSGKQGIRRYRTSPRMQRPFCGRCGSPLPSEDAWEGQLFVPVGPLEGRFEAVSQGHIFAASKAPWLELTDGLPCVDAYPEGVALPVLADLERSAEAPVGSEHRPGGSCLCGKVAWRSEGAPALMRHCHCLRCRRGRAAAHATNAFVPEGKLEWLRGEDGVAIFALPEAERFSQAFCSDCGGKVPCRVAARGFYNVPAGSFDDDPGIGPSEHIFVGSKAAWHVITDEIPQFETYREH